MSSEQTLTAFANLAASSRRLQWIGPAQLELELSAPVNFTVLRQLADSGIVAEFTAGTRLQQLFDRRDPGEAPLGPLRFKVPRLAETFVVARNLEDLLSVVGTFEKAPAAYILVDAQEAPRGVQAYCSNQAPNESPADARRYQDAVRLWGLIKGRAEHTDLETNSLLFFGLRQTKLAPGFSSEDLKVEVFVSEIADFILSTDAPKVRAQIFASTLSEFLRDQTPSTAFAYLLRTSEHFSRRLREGLAMHLAEHSPEKLALEGQKSALEFSEKLEKVVSGLETKSLAIPIALLLTVKDLQVGGGWTTTNTMLLVSVLLFAITMTLVHLSQRSILRVLGASAENITQSLRSRGLEEKNPVLTEVFAGLKKRRKLAQWASAIMCGAAWIPVVVLSVVVFLAAPKPPAAQQAATDPNTPAAQPATPARKP